MSLNHAYLLRHHGFKPERGLAIQHLRSSSWLAAVSDSSEFRYLCCRMLYSELTRSAGDPDLQSLYLQQLEELEPGIR
jgi:hypothetical protein